MSETVKTKKTSSAKRAALRKKRRRKERIWRYIRRFFLSVFTVLLVAVIGAYILGEVMFLGPSQTFADQLALSMLETSALKFVPRLYYNNEQMEALIARNSVVLPDVEVDTSLVKIELSETAQAQREEIELEEVTGPTYHGYMMIIRDPSRVSVGVCRENFSSGKAGKQLYEIAEAYGAVAAINGGAFQDKNGVGNGGVPVGIVYSQGKALKTNNDATGNERCVMGFDTDNKLVVGVMNGEQAKAKNLRDAVTFGPALVINGEAVKVSGSGSGLNPRSAIGQTADGSVLLLVIDGRKVNSIGASIADLIRIMLDYGAVNAGNLDGGSSSLLYYNGQYVNEGVTLTGSRAIPTAFIVR